MLAYYLFNCEDKKLSHIGNGALFCRNGYFVIKTIRTILEILLEKKIVMKIIKVDESKISDDLFNIVKLVFRDKMDWNCPVEVWRMWIKKETKSWNHFVQWFLDYNKNIDLKLREFLHMHNGEFEAFTKNWVAEDEQTSFYEFYAEKKWEEVLSNIQKFFTNTAKNINNTKLP